MPFCRSRQEILKCRLLLISTLLEKEICETQATLKKLIASLSWNSQNVQEPVTIPCKRSTALIEREEQVVDY